MEKQKFSFINRIIFAIKLDKYQELANEKFTEAIKFTLKLMLISSLIISIAITFKFNKMINEGTFEQYVEELPKTGVSNVDIKQMTQEITKSNRVYVSLAFYISASIYFFIIYSLLAFMDIILLSILGFFVSRTFKVKLKYSALYNIGTYSLTLSIILNIIYVIVNLLSGIKIEYFTLVYNIISYIYLFAAILIIKSEIIKTNLELMAIVEEQKKVEEEIKEDKEKDQEEQPEKQEKEDKEEKKKNNDRPVPEGENG